MRSRARGFTAVLSVVAVALSCGAGSASAAKVTATVPGGRVPDASGPITGAITRGVLTQTFELTGKKVKNRQVRDVNLTVNTIGSGPFAGLNVNFTLRAPSGENLTLGGSFVQSLQNVTYDDQSRLRFCDPNTFKASYCNYLIGVAPNVVASGIASGPTNSFALNPVFRGLNAKGTWTLKAYDQIPAGFGPVSQTNILGVSTLEITTGKKFAKESDGGGK